MEKPKLKVVILQEVYDKIMHFVDKSTVEVSGIGTVKTRGNIMIVTDAMLVPQRNGPTSTDIEPEDMAKAMYELRNAEGDLNFWWHSHVNMSVFWSGTDRDTIKQLGRGGWILATVFNKKRELRSAVHFQDPFTNPVLGDHIFLDELPTEIWRPEYPAETMAKWDEEYKRNVEDVKPKPRPVSKYSDYKHWSTYTGRQGNLYDDGDIPVQQYPRALVDVDQMPPPGFKSKKEFRKYMKKHRKILEAKPTDLPMLYDGYQIKDAEELEWMQEYVMSGQGDDRELVDIMLDEREVGNA